MTTQTAAATPVLVQWAGLVRRAIGGAALVALLVVSVALIVPGLFGMQRYVITSGSMTGTYDTGSIVFDQVVPADELEVGDVITYLPPADSGVDHLVTHRIVSMRSKDGHTTFHTRGDANPGNDPWTFELASATQPRVAFAVPFAGWVFIHLADPGTRRLVIGIPAAVIGLIALRDLVGALRPDRRRDGSEPSGPTATVRGA